MNTNAPLIDNNETEAPNPGAFLSAGFRPFFLFAGLYGLVPILAWVWAYLGDGDTPGEFAPAYWHGHEMIFGFVIAAATGFLLTAVPNWTGSQPFKGTPLAMLALIWVSGRFAMWFGWPLGPAFVALVDLSMIPVLIIYIGRRLFVHGVSANYIVLVILGVLFIANLSMHLEALGIFPDSASLGLYLGVFAVVFLVTMISGRVIPVFTANVLFRKGINVYTETPTKVTRLVVVSVVLAIISNLFGDDSDLARYIAGALTLLAAIALFIRMGRWKSFMILDEPIMWILHAGHFWLIIGFALLAAANFSDDISRDAGIHALTSGTMGTMIIAMLTRVALGHSGRVIKASTPIIVAYYMIIAGSVMRVLAALFQLHLPAEGYAILIGSAGLIWAGGFAVFVIVFWPILTRPRAD